MTRLLPLSALSSALLSLAVAAPLGAAGEPDAASPPPAGMETGADRTAPDPPIGRRALERGREVFEQTCIKCHGDAHSGAPRIGDAPDWESRLDQGLQVLVRHALEGHGGADGMPAKGGFAELGNEDVAAAVSYIATESDRIGPEAERIVSACQGAEPGERCTPEMARKYLILYLFQGLSGKDR